VVLKNTITDINIIYEAVKTRISAQFCFKIVGKNEEVIYMLTRKDSILANSLIYLSISFAGHVI
jgi:hypothetical protein